MKWAMIIYEVNMENKHKQVFLMTSLSLENDTSSMGVFFGILQARITLRPVFNTVTSMTC